LAGDYNKYVNISRNIREIRCNNAVQQFPRSPKTWAFEWVHGGVRRRCSVELLL